MTRRYQILKPDDILDIVRAESDPFRNPPWCTIESDSIDDAVCKRFGTSCADTLCEEECLKAWLEEEVEE